MYAVSKKNNQKKKIIRFISGKYKQLNHKFSQQFKVTKQEVDFSNFFTYWEKNLSFRKYPDMCGQGLSAFLKTESLQPKSHPM